MSYRESHLNRGLDYDEALARNPFDAFMVRRERAILAKVIPALHPEGLQRSLDFACGTGRITEILDALAAQSFGVDVSSSMVAVARPLCGRTQFFLQDITRTPLPIEPVQVVTAFRFFGNAEDPLRVAVLDAIREALVPRGYLVLNNHRNPWTIDGLLSRGMGERPSGDLGYWKLRRLLRAAGFRIRRSYGIGVWPRLRREEILKSPWAARFEALSVLPLVAPLCPDAIIVAQRT